MVYNPDGSVLAQSLREAAKLLGCSHTSVANYSDTVNGDYYLREIPDPNRARGKDKQPRKQRDKVWYNREW